MRFLCLAFSITKSFFKRSSLRFVFELTGRLVFELECKVFSSTSYIILFLVLLHLFPPRFSALGSLLSLLWFWSFWCTLWTHMHDLLLASLFDYPVASQHYLCPAWCSTRPLLYYIWLSFLFSWSHALIPHPSVLALCPHTFCPLFLWFCPLNTIFSSTCHYADYGSIHSHGVAIW